jgi:hypothetical protein
MAPPKTTRIGIWVPVPVLVQSVQHEDETQIFQSRRTEVLLEAEDGRVQVLRVTMLFEPEGAGR